jgi:hypothetical protein
VRYVPEESKKEKGKERAGGAYQVTRMEAGIMSVLGD